MNGDPAESPAGQDEAFGESVAGENGHGARQLGHVVELVAREDHVAVDLVGDDGQLEALGQIDELAQVFARVHATARIRRIVHQNRHRLLVD